MNIKLIAVMEILQIEVSTFCDTMCMYRRSSPHQQKAPQLTADAAASYLYLIQGRVMSGVLNRELIKAARLGGVKKVMELLVAGADPIARNELSATLCIMPLFRATPTWRSF